MSATDGGGWRKRPRLAIEPRPAGPAPRVVRLVAELSALPAASLLEHDAAHGADDADADEPRGADGGGLFDVGPELGVGGAGAAGGGRRRGLGALLFDAEGAAFVGVALLPGGGVARVCGRVLQSFDCTDDCCARALVRLRVQREDARAASTPAHTALANSELNLGDFWNWTSAACDFETSHVYDCGARARDALVARHFGALGGGEMGGLVCVGAISVVVDGAAPAKPDPEPPEGAAALDALGAACAAPAVRSWAAELEWLERQRARAPHARKLLASAAPGVRK